MKDAITRGLGSLTPQAWAELSRVANFWRDRGPEVVRLLATVEQRGVPPIVREIDALITGAQKIEGSARWRYSWVQARWNPATDAWDVVEDGLTGEFETRYALNLVEGGNTESLAYGYATDDDELEDYPGMSVRPVPNGTPVRLSMVRGDDGTLGYFFTTPMKIDRGCEDCPGGEPAGAGGNPRAAWGGWPT